MFEELTHRFRRRTLLNTRCLSGVVKSVKYTFKNWVREVVEEVIDDKMCNANLENKRLNASGAEGLVPVTETALRNATIIFVVYF